MGPDLKRTLKTLGEDLKDFRGLGKTLGPGLGARSQNILKIVGIRSQHIPKTLGSDLRDFRDPQRLWGKISKTFTLWDQISKGFGDFRPDLKRL